MALRPLVSKLRLVFFPPIALLDLLVFVIAGRLFPFMQRILSWLSHGAKVHLWRVLIIARRWTRSQPTWKPEDILNVGLVFQPFTAAQRLQAQADLRLQHVVCPCGRKQCRFPHGTFVPNMVIDLDALLAREIVRIQSEPQNKE